MSSLVSSLIQEFDFWIHSKVLRLQHLFFMWIWAIDVVTLFLRLASNMISAVKRDSNNSIVILSSSWTWEVTLQFTCLLKGWKRKWLENVFIILWPGNSSGLIGSNEGKTLLKQLSISTKWPLIRPCCLVKELSERVCWWRGNSLHELIRE